MAGSGEPGALDEWRAHWRVMVPCFAGIVLCSAHGYSLGVMIRPIEQEFGWARAEISAGLLILSVIALVASPVAGTAVDRLGARRIALVGVPVYCASLAMLATAGSVGTWWGLWAILALANMTVMPAVWLAILNGYFVKSRGLAMAVALSGTGMGAAIYPFLLNTLIEWQGWREAYVILAGIALLIVFPVTFFLFRPVRLSKPESLQNSDAGAQGPASSARGQVWSVRYLKLAAAATIYAIACSALTANTVPVLIDQNLTPAVAAATAGLLGIGSIAGRLLGGFLLDRFNGNMVAAICVLIPIIPITIFLNTDGSQAWAAVACLVMGLSIGTEVDCCAYLAARHFGTRNFGALFGTINGLLLFGNGLAPFLANYGYDVMKTYDYVLLALTPLYVVTSYLFATLGRYPDFDEDGIPLQQESRAPA
ncbi:MAG: MFS transporter [Novosphingobium sp.]|nr:MFS transporter [Novosphingobium sp.]MCP5401957.1 MFS transporter [Novosphingobium sp.]